MEQEGECGEVGGKRTGRGAAAGAGGRERGGGLHCTRTLDPAPPPPLEDNDKIITIINSTRTK